MDVEFTIDFLNFKLLQKRLKNAPRVMHLTAVATVNDLAFAARAEGPKVIASKMTVRNPRFIASRFVVRKATGGKPEAFFGSIPGRINKAGYESFTGWKEQQFGTAPQRERVPNVKNTRWGNNSNSIPAANRLKSGKEFFKPGQGRFDQFRAHDPAAIPGFLREVRKVPKRQRKPIMLGVDRKRLRARAVYIMNADNKLKTIWRLKAFRVKRFRWAHEVARRVATQRNVARFFLRNLGRKLFPG